MVTPCLSFVKDNPRYVVLSVCCNSTSCNIIFTRLAFVDNVNSVVNDFVLFIFTHLSYVRLANMLAASCSLSCAVDACFSLHHSTRSLSYIACTFHYIWKLLNQVIVKIRNRVSHTTPPCGTPCLRRPFLRFALSTVTLALRLCRYDLIHLCMFTPIPHRLSLRSNPSVHTISNAFWRSIQIANVYLLKDIIFLSLIPVWRDRVRR